MGYLLNRVRCCFAYFVQVVAEVGVVVSDGTGLAGVVVVLLVLEAKSKGM